MREIAAALAQALAEQGDFALVTGRQADDVSPLVEAASYAVVAPGPTTRLSVAAGMRLGGSRVVALLDDFPEGATPDEAVISVTTLPGCAAAALTAGWTVVQPWSAADVAPLLEAADVPTMVFLCDETDLDFDDPPAARRTRLWLDGDLATLVASGPAVPAAVRLAERLQDRGVDIAAVEVAVLNSPGQAAMVGGRALLVAGRDTVSAFRGLTWPEVPTTAVALDGKEEADLIGAVLAVVQTA